GPGVGEALVEAAEPPEVVAPDDEIARSEALDLLVSALERNAGEPRLHPLLDLDPIAAERRRPETREQVRRELPARVRRARSEARERLQVAPERVSLEDDVVVDEEEY